MSFKYAIGVIRSLEAQMLEENKLQRMIEAKDFESAFHIINETNYGAFFSKITIPFDFEAVFDLAQREIKSLFDHLAPKNKQIKAYWLRYDYENIKTLFKSKVINQAPPKLYSVGPYNIQSLDENLPIEIKKLLERIEKSYSLNKDIIEAFNLIDEAYKNHYKTIISNLPDNSKYYASGIEPLLNFLFYKEGEIKKLRFILECKKNKIEKDMIRNNYE